MKTLVISLLSWLTRYKLGYFKPTIVAVTGSVGKTSTKNAIAIALGSKYRVRSAYKNYNNEIGLPLTVFGEHSPGKNAWAWLKLLVRVWRTSDMPEYLVLEYGVDQPGDMARLVRVARPNVAVITAISPVHLANYPNLESLIDEKAALGEMIAKTGLVLLNGDDSRVVDMRRRFKASVQTYSLTNGDVYATNIRMEYPDHEDSFVIGDTVVIMRAVLHAGHESAELVLHNCVSTSLVSSVLAAVGVAVHFGVPLRQATTALSTDLQPANGRLRPLPGIKGSLILDDTYNAAPASVLAGLEALAQFSPGEEYDRRLAVLGDMAELGALSDSEHRAIGVRVAQVADLFIAVGPHMKLAVQAAEAAGMDRDKLTWFKNSVEAGRYLDRIIQTGDVILVKGSQSQRMEKTVKDIMAEPARAADFLVRQEQAWLKE